MKITTNPYDLTPSEWQSLSFWQKVRMLLWVFRYKRGDNCEFIRGEFLHKSLKGEGFRCWCETDNGPWCKSKCWCKCTPDGTLSQGFGDKTKYIYKGEE